MTRQPLFILGLLFFCAAGMLTFLVLSTGSPNDRPNGFTRRGLDGGKAVYRYELALGETLYKIAGSTSQQVFFTGRDPRILYRADRQLRRLPPLTVPFPLSSQVLVAYDVRLDSPWVSLYANNLSAVFSARLGDTIVQRSNLPGRLFTAIVPLPHQHFVVRAFDSAGDRQVFKKIVPGANKPLNEAPIIPGTGDAGFSADGMLRYDSATRRLLYVQFYQNRFFCMDTSLHLVYTGKTIDTTNTNPVYTRQIRNEPGKGSLLPAVPVHIVNQACTTDGAHLYVLSTLRADNEDPYDFNRNAVVDVYDIVNGAYKRSFYIPDLHRQKAQNIMIANRQLLVGYLDYIALYEIPNR